MSFREFITKNQEIVQIIYGVILIISIPALIAYNTFTNVNNFNAGLDTALQREAMTVGRLIYATLKPDLGNEELIQGQIRRLAAQNTDLKEVMVLAPEGEVFRVIASSKETDIGQNVNFLYYKMAMNLADNDALATDSLKLVVSPDGQSLVGGFSADDRYWLVALPMSDNAGAKQLLLTMKISSKLIDDNTEETRKDSTYLLALTIIVVIVFLSFTVRIWDYAVLYKKIKEVDQMKDEFISIASHELRTPLTVTKGYLSMVLEGTFGKISNPEIEKALNTAAKSNNRLEGLVEDLLNVSRIEQGRLEVVNQKIEIAPLIEDVVSQLKINADEKNLILEYSGSGKNLPMVMTDAERLRQVLINLIGNSIKYTENGSVKVTTLEKNGIMEIRIADTGIGMSAEDQKKLFQKFYRVQNEKTNKIIGTGLGLWITRQIVELMKGKITIESMEGVGTQVIVQLQAEK